MLYYYPDKSIGKLDALALFCQLNYKERSYDNENVVFLKPEFLEA